MGALCSKAENDFDFIEDEDLAGEFVPPQNGISNSALIFQNEPTMVVMPPLDASRSEPTPPTLPPSPATTEIPTTTEIPKTSKTQTPTTTKLPMTTETPTQPKRNNSNSMTENRHRNSLMRVTSRLFGMTDRGPLQKRASNYNHVHEAVMHNFSEHGSSHRGIPPGVVGLRNLGNTCFMNSSIQCLSNTIPLTDYFLGYDYRKEINHENFLGTGGKLATAWAELVKSIWLSKSMVVEPSGFKKSMATFAPQFSGCQQHDAQEMISFLLDGIHEDLNRVQKKPYIEEKDCDGTNDEQDAIESWKNYLLRNKSLIVDLFQGQVRSTCCCRQCGHQNIRFEPFMYLSLPISDSCTSVEDCLKLYLAEEDLIGDNQWYCEKCKTHVDAKKKIDLWMLPPILIIHLKRFKYNESGMGGSKNNVVLRYPIKSWDLCKQVRSKGGEYPLYDMYAVSNHLGGLGSGHYTAYALNRFDDKWYEFNDSTSQAIDPEQKITKSSTPYLLFYNRASQEDDEMSGSSGRGMMIRRQSENRPDLWPHAQVRDAKFRDYSRTSLQLGSNLNFRMTDFREEDEHENIKVNNEANGNKIEVDRPSKTAREKGHLTNGTESPGAAKRTTKKKGVSRTDDRSNGMHTKRKKTSTTSNSKP